LNFSYFLYATVLNPLEYLNVPKYKIVSFKTIVFLRIRFVASIKTLAII